MTYQQIQPPAYLKSHVRYFWVLEHDAVTDSPKTFRPITDGCPGLFFQRAEAGTFYDQDQKQLPTLFLYGQTIRHRELHTSGRLDAMGVCLYPYALQSVFGLDADELTDTCVDADLVSQRQTDQVSSQLANAALIPEQIKLLSIFLSNQIRHNNAQPDTLIDYALEQLINAQGRISLDELRGKLNVTERSLERRFKQRVGISPKLFSRICRFQSSLSQLRTSDYGKLSDIAFENGYADQSHFIRAFNEFTGFNPCRYRSQSSGIVENLTEWAR